MNTRQKGASAIRSKLLLIRQIHDQPRTTQRKLAGALGVSLGKTNQTLNACIEEGFLQREGAGYALTKTGRALLDACRVDNAVILAAGFGSRFMPVTLEIPKGLVAVEGTPLIERQIVQLQERGIEDITIVVGYLKEKFDYLIDRYGVKLVYNPEYATRNNLASLYLVREQLGNSYVLSSDNWMRHNLFHSHEVESWYAGVYKAGPTAEWCVKTGPGERIAQLQIGGRDSWVLYGPVFFSAAFSQQMRGYLEEYYRRYGAEEYLWEQILMDKLRALDMRLNRQPEDVVYEFENFDELRDFDRSYLADSRSRVIRTIAGLMETPESAIGNITQLKAGLSNRTFHFAVAGKEYVLRLPVDNQALLVNRRQEQAVNEAIGPLGLSDRLTTFDPQSGVRIGEYIAGARHPDPANQEDARRCMAALRHLHESAPAVAHPFDVGAEIRRYLELGEQNNAILFSDYRQVAQGMERLAANLRLLSPPAVLCHVDNAAENFLLLPDGTARLVDWEYAGMGDGLLDVAMFAIDAGYGQAQIDALLAGYLGRGPTDEETLRLYGWVALGGFLWAMWAEYKQSLGVEFGEYALKMYRYAKEYARRADALAKEAGLSDYPMEDGSWKKSLVL